MVTIQKTEQEQSEMLLTSTPLVLWDCLHDAELRSLQREASQKVTIELSIPFLLTFHHIPNDVTFSLTVRPLLSEQAVLYFSRDHRSSISWNAAEHLFNASECWISDGEYVHQANHVQLSLLGWFPQNDRFLNLMLEGQHLDVTRSDGHPCSLSCLLRMGTAYWEAFAANKEGGSHGDTQTCSQET